jgi:hypothetical protein
MIATNFRAVNRGALLGTFDLQLPSGMILKSCCLFSKADGSRFVSGPSKKIGQGDAVKYEKLLDFTTRDVAEKFSRAALEAVDALGVAR